MKRKVLDKDSEKNREVFIDMARGQLCAAKTAGKGDCAARGKAENCSPSRRAGIV